MIVAGFDPGLASLGQARIERVGQRYACHLAATVRTPSSDTDDVRMLAIWNALVFGDVVAVEAQHGAWVGNVRAGRSSADSVKVREVVGLIRARAYEARSRLVLVTPEQVRRALGLPRNASKEQVRAVVVRLVTSLPKLLSSHAVDAVAIAIAGERIARGTPEAA